MTNHRPQIGFTLFLIHHMNWNHDNKVSRTMVHITTIILGYLHQATLTALWKLAGLGSKLDNTIRGLFFFDWSHYIWNELRKNIWSNLWGKKTKVACGWVGGSLSCEFDWFERWRITPFRDCFVSINHPPWNQI